MKSHFSKPLWAAALFIVFVAIYAPSRDQTYTYDGLLFGGMAETDLTRVDSNITFEWNHFLWYPTGRTFYLALNLLHIKMRGYQALQLLNAVTGAAGVAVTFLILAGLVSQPWAVAWSLVSGFCAVYWIRSASAENYLLGTFWVICFAGLLVSYWREPSDRHMAFMVISAVLSAYYHLGNIAIFGSAFAAILLRQNLKGVILQGTGAALLFAFLWLPYAVVHQWFRPGGFSRWWVWSKGLAEGYSPLQRPTGAFHLNVWNNVTVTAQTFMKSILWFDSWNGAAVIRFGALIFFAALAISYQRWKYSVGDAPQKNERSVAFILLIPLLSVTGLYAVWLPGMPSYWCVHTALFCLFAGVLSGQLSSGRLSPVPMICMGLVIGLLAAQNLRAAVLPERVNPRQSVIDASSKIGKVIPPPSQVIISGRGEEWSYLKVYLPYFGHRNRLAIDLFIQNGLAQHVDPVLWMQQEISANFDHGVPVYITGDALDEKGAFSDFNISSKQIEAIWRPFQLFPIMDLSGDVPNRLYLLWPGNSPQNVQDGLRATLIASGLLDQLLIVDREKVRTNPSEKLADEIRILEAVVLNRSVAKSKNSK